MRSDDTPHFGTASSELIARRTGGALSAVEDGVRVVGRRVTDASPRLAPPILKAWYLYVSLYIRAVALKNAIRYEALIDPFAIYWVHLDRDVRWLDPDAPEFESRFPGPKFKYAGRVMDSDWDRAYEPFEETDLYRAFEAHFERGVPWADTEFFARVVGEIEDGRHLWGCRSREEFERRCARLDRLYHAIRDHGYRTQAGLAAGGIEDPIDKAGASTVKRFIYDEMTVSVGRDGELIFNDGRDRLAIAKLLDLKAVPVWIMLRHAEWQRLRDAVAAGDRDLHDLPADLRTHPDLRGLGPVPDEPARD